PGEARALEEFAALTANVGSRKVNSGRELVAGEDRSRGRENIFKSVIERDGDNAVGGRSFEGCFQGDAPKARRLDPSHLFRETCRTCAYTVIGCQMSLRIVRDAVIHQDRNPGSGRSSATPARPSQSQG